MTNETQSEDIEKLSEKIHHLYCAQYEKDHGNPYHTGGDYSKLDERMKEYDRNIARFITQLLKAERERIINTITTHTEHDGSYCDTGEDMEWACRSDCVSLAVARIRALTSHD